MTPPDHEGVATVQPDPVVAAMLTRLPVPDHADGFWEHLEASLDSTPGLPVRPLVAPEPDGDRPANDGRQVVIPDPVADAPKPAPTTAARPLAAAATPAPAPVPAATPMHPFTTGLLALGAAAAAVVAVIAGITLMRDADGSLPQAADRSEEQPGGATSTAAKVTGTTAAPASPTPPEQPGLSQVEGEPSTPEDAATTFVAAVDDGATDRAFALLAPGSQATAGDPGQISGLTTLSTGDYGTLRDAVDLEIARIPVGRAGGGEVGVVVLDGMVQLDTGRARTTLELPYRTDGAGLVRVDPWSPGSGVTSPIEYTSPVPVDGEAIAYGTILEVEPDVGVEALLPRWARSAVLSVDGEVVQRATYEPDADRIIRFDPQAPLAPGIHRVTVAALGGDHVTASSLLLKAR